MVDTVLTKREFAILREALLSCKRKKLTNIQCFGHTFVNYDTDINKLINKMNDWKTDIVVDEKDLQETLDMMIRYPG